MSEEPKLAAVEKVKIPEQKVKNPGRVAAGKRLAEISKEAKARKAEERKKAESECIENSNLLYVSAGVLGVVGLGYGIYNFLCKKKSRNNNNNNNNNNKSNHNNNQKKK